MKDTAKKENSPANDYALAKILNERAIKIFTLVVDHKSTPDLTAVNRSYVLLADELQRIYARQPELQKIGLPICWRVISNLEQIHETAVDYIIETTEAHVDETTGDYVESAADYGEGHNSMVSRLCIIDSIVEPKLTTEVQKLVEETDKNIHCFKHELDKMYATLSFEGYSTPVVRIGDTSYRLRAMRNAIPFQIISYCFEEHPDTFVPLTSINKYLQVEEYDRKKETNLSERIRGSYFDKEDGPLQSFIEVSPLGIKIKKTSAVTDQQLDLIRANSK